MVKFVKNVLMYYYNLEAKKIKKIKMYYFVVDDKNNSYIFQLCDRTKEELIELYDLTQILINSKIYCHELILNNNTEFITFVDNKAYILMKNKICSNDNISLNDVIDFSIKTSNFWNYNSLNRTNWVKLWYEKLQNLEYQISQFQDKYNSIYYGFNYFVGIVENSVQLMNYMHIDNLRKFSVSHKRLTYKTTLNEFYNPLNYVIDYSIRDAAEYIKSRLIDNLDSIYQYEFCIKSLIYNKNEKKLLFARIFYPSYQLDEYEKYFFETTNDKKELQLMLNSNDNYEKNIKKMYKLIKLYIEDMPYIEWII